MPDNPIKMLANGAALVGELIKVAGDDPNVKEAGSNLGRTALTVTKLINNALLPLAAINFAFDKAREYFAKRFQSDLSEKVSTIPAEHIVEPKASIAGPALQGLAFTHEEVNLKEMYLSLLATAMDGRISAQAHPAFVEIIKQLASEESALLRDVLRSSTPIPIAEFRFTTAGDGGWVTVARHVLNVITQPGGNPEETPRLSAMVDNWVRLGLVEVDYLNHLVAEKAYSWVDGRPEYVACRSRYEAEGRTMNFQKGILRRTSLGEQFAAAVGLA